MARAVKFILAYLTLGSVIAPGAMRWLDSCHISPYVEDIIMSAVMIAIVVVSLAISWRMR